MLFKKKAALNSFRESLLSKVVSVAESVSVSHLLIIGHLFCVYKNRVDAEPYS